MTVAEADTSHRAYGLAATLAAVSIVWTLVAFGGAFTWTYPPTLAALLVAAACARPAIARRGTRALDVALTCCLGWTLLQLVPLPVVWREAISPHAGAVDLALRFDGAVRRSRPLSLDPPATWNAAVLMTMLLAMFWTTREVCERYGVRRLVRVVAWTGLGISIVAVLFLGTPEMVYGLFHGGERSRVYGPFVNRNHMGTWLVMALLLVTGYVFARFQDRTKGTLASAVDTPMVWLIGAAGAMAMGVIGSLSRSTFVGALAGVIFLVGMAVRRGGRARWGVLVVIGVGFLVLIANPRTADLGRRFEHSGTTPTWGRMQIWRDTAPMVRDFALTGTGAGSYGTAMLVYQRSDRRLFFNQAHNQYLQLAAEGGLMLLIPLACAAVALTAGMASRLRDDRSPMFWIRAGACAGIVGVLVQGLWETGLRFPANGLLFAALCGIAVHERRPARAVTGRSDHAGDGQTDHVGAPRTMRHRKRVGTHPIDLAPSRDRMQVGGGNRCSRRRRPRARQRDSAQVRAQHVGPKPSRALAPQGTDSGPASPAAPRG